MALSEAQIKQVKDTSVRLRRLAQDMEKLAYIAEHGVLFELNNQVVPISDEVAETIRLAYLELKDEMVAAFAELPGS